MKNFSFGTCTIFTQVCMQSVVLSAVDLFAFALLLPRGWHMHGFHDFGGNFLTLFSFRQSLLHSVSKSRLSWGVSKRSVALVEEVTVALQSLVMEREWLQLQLLLLLLPVDLLGWRYTSVMSIKTIPLSRIGMWLQAQDHCFFQTVVHTVHPS